MPDDRGRARGPDDGGRARGPVEVRGTVEAVWKQESARIVAGLLRTVRDVGVAEALAQDALVAALEQWPVDGVPDNPAAWLTTIAKRRAIDHLRRSARPTDPLCGPSRSWRP